VAECTNVPKEVADKALAHRIANAVEAAYRRTDFFDRRRVLMDEWAEFLLAQKSTTHPSQQPLSPHIRSAP
jgi:hypothetical protein